MRQMSLSDFRRVSTEEMETLLPTELTSNGKPFAIVHHIGEVISLEGLNPFMKLRLLNLEKLARPS